MVDDDADIASLVAELEAAWPVAAGRDAAAMMSLPSPAGAAAAIEAAARSLAGRLADVPCQAPYQRSWEPPEWREWQMWETQGRDALVAGLRQLGLEAMAEVVAAAPLSTC